jgi:molybdenum cofactor guanylyltransferase
MYKDVTGLLLMGGRSTRFGRDKAAFLIEGRPMAEHVASAMRPLVHQMLVSMREPTQDVPVLAEPVFDVHPGKGPIAGLHAGLRACRTSWLLAAACDMPFLTEEVLATLVDARKDERTAVVAQTPDGQLQPLCALYPARILPQVEHTIASGRYSLHALLDDIDPCTEIVIPAGFLRNINSPEDLFQPE